MFDSFVQRDLCSAVSPILSSLTSILDEPFPSVVKRAGQTIQPLPEPFWMYYDNHISTGSSLVDWAPGTLCVTQNLSAPWKLKLENVSAALTRLIPTLDWDPDKFQFMLTVGNVLPHRGGTRSCSFNLGVQYSSCAVTEVSSCDCDQDFSKARHCLDVVTQQDGFGLFLNVKKIHAVRCLDTCVTLPRLQLTYGWDEPYDVILKRALSCLN